MNVKRKNWHSFFVTGNNMYFEHIAFRIYVHRKFFTELTTEHAIPFFNNFIQISDNLNFKQGGYTGLHTILLKVIPFFGEPRKKLRT